MQPYLIRLLILFLALSSCTHAQEKKSAKHKPETAPTTHAYTNRLINETSPYLLQHAHNPVDWYPWGPEALKKAKQENKLILISIGYAACHWCHVMERESFEDTTVARLMNEHFVAVKVDREERPDVDQIYMDAVQKMTGHGGWPLNCLAMPDGKPVFGGTYFPKKQWLELLKRMVDIHQKYPSELQKQADLITRELQTKATDVGKNEEQTNPQDLALIVKRWKRVIDYENGGMQRAPKFPLPASHLFLMQYYFHTKDQDALKAVTTTLDRMAEGGIYDQVGGGFARYSTDQYWKVPHFEKMLYDNAQLVSLYAKAYQLTQKPLYARIVRETLSFVERELLDASGGFYSSLDADSEGEEGKFYTWTQEEIRQVLGNQASLVEAYYNITAKGNWENGQNILHITQAGKRKVGKRKLSEPELEKHIRKAKKALLKARNERVRPGLDDKILTAWNALMLRAYADAYRALGEKHYLAVALKNANFLQSKLRADGSRLHRSYKNGRATINGFLDDYAFTISAYIALYQATFDESWLLEARQLTDYVFKHFLDPQSPLFFYTSDLDPALIARKMEIEDNVIPSSNSEMAKNLFLLGHYFFEDDYLKQAARMFEKVRADALENGVYYANWNALLGWLVHEPYEVVIAGSDHSKVRREFDRQFLPHVLLSGGGQEGNLPLIKNKMIAGQTTIYVCQNRTCKLPVTEVEAALKQIMP